MDQVDVSNFLFGTISQMCKTQNIIKILHAKLGIRKTIYLFLLVFFWLLKQTLEKLVILIGFGFILKNQYARHTVQSNSLVLYKAFDKKVLFCLAKQPFAFTESSRRAQTVRSTHTVIRKSPQQEVTPKVRGCSLCLRGSVGCYVRSINFLNLRTLDSSTLSASRS